MVRLSSEGWISSVVKWGWRRERSQFCMVRVLAVGWGRVGVEGVGLVEGDMV